MKLSIAVKLDEPPTVMFLYAAEVNVNSTQSLFTRMVPVVAVALSHTRPRERSFTVRPAGSAPETFAFDEDAGRVILTAGTESLP